MISEDLKELLTNTSPVEDVKEELENLDLPDLETDPEFVADLMKAQLVEDILRVMDEQGINKNQLAQLLGKSRQYVGRILNETANFTIDTVAQLACALKCSVQVKLFEHDEILVVKKIEEYRMQAHQMTVKPLSFKLEKQVSCNEAYQHLTPVTGDGYDSEKFKFVS